MEINLVIKAPQMRLFKALELALFGSIPFEGQLRDGEETMNLEMNLVVKPWWMRFFKALELALFGAILFGGQIRDLREQAERP